MARINEEDVACSESAEKIDRDALHRGFYELGEAGKAIFEKCWWVRLDTDKLAGAARRSISLKRGGEHECSVAAANLNDPLRPVVADERISNFGIDALKESVVKVEMLVVDPGFGKVPLIGIGKYVGVQEIDLILKAKIDSRERAADSPVFAMKGFEAGYGKVEMRWCDIYA